MPFYFAYGSNLLSHRLLARCPSARVQQVTTLADHRVAIAKESYADGSGKATILPARGVETRGVLYTLAETDLTTLDAIEGVGKGYARIRCMTAAGPARTYVATDPAPTLQAFAWYVALMIAGALEHDLGEPALNTFRAMAHRPDPAPDRPGAQAAQAALSAAGHPNWAETLLRAEH